MLGFARIGFFGGGPVACITAAWMSSWGWRRQSRCPEDEEMRVRIGTSCYDSLQFYHKIMFCFLLGCQNSVGTTFDVLWRIMQPVMFCFMGADLEIDQTSYDMRKLLLSVGVLLLAWLVRKFFLEISPKNV